MKHYLLCLAALLLCTALGAAIVFPLLRKKRGLWKKLLLSALLGLALAAIGGGVFVSVYYHAAPEAAAALQTDATVTVETIGKGYFFDGPGTEAALVFYPGAKVASEAYAPLLRALAKDGLDCFLVRMPPHGSAGHGRRGRAAAAVQLRQLAAGRAFPGRRRRGQFRWGEFRLL